MGIRGAWFVACLGMGLALGGGARAEHILYVAEGGHDHWTGNLAAPAPGGDDGPLATIQGARDRIRALRELKEGIPEGGIRVLISVDQRLSESLVFRPEDSGTADRPIVYAAAPGTRPVISGGVDLELARWEETEDGIWVAEAPELAAAAVQPLSFWTQGERRIRARTPNGAQPFGDYPPDSDFFRTNGQVLEANDEGVASVPSRTQMKFQGEDLKDWASLPHANIVVFHSWETSILRVAELDGAGETVRFTGPAHWPFGQWQGNQRYFVENLLEALDAPGEWYFDPEAYRVHYLPLAEERAVMEAGGDSWRATLPLVERLLVLEGVPEEGAFVEHLHFRGLHFAHSHFPLAAEGYSDAQAAYSVSGAIEATGARHCVWEGCSVVGTSNHGIWLRRGSQHNRVIQCAFEDLGAGGVRIGERRSADTEDEATEHNTVDNCLLREGGRIFRSAVGVWIGRSSHNQITHNAISHFRYTGVSVGWSWGYDPSSAHHNVIAYNHIHQIGMGQLNDMGGIYTLGDSPGTVLRGNVIHDVRSHPELYGGWGLYTDEGSTGILLEGNLVYNTETGGFHQHYGKDNRVVNNIFAFSHGPQIIRTRAEEHNSFFFENNIVYFRHGPLLGSNWSGENYVLRNNMYWNTEGDVDFEGKDLATWQGEGKDEGTVIADPLFRDGPGGDFRFAEGSPALERGFVPIDCAKAGLYGEAAWVARDPKCPGPATPLPGAP